MSNDNEKKETSPEDIKEAFNKLWGNDPTIRLVEKNDTFSFKCTRCGKCCMGYRNDIILNPYDIYKIAKELNISCSNVIEKYCSFHIGEHSNVPIITIDHDKSNGWCKFLEFDVKEGGVFGCSVNNSKPGACMNHPIGAVRTSVNGKDQTIQYILTDMCEYHEEEEVTVGDWVKKYEESLEEVNKGNELVVVPLNVINTEKFMKILNDPNNDELNISKETKELMVHAYTTLIIGNLYCNYDTDRPFIEQADENKKETEDKLTELKLYIKLGGIDLTPVIRTSKEEE